MFAGTRGDTSMYLFGSGGHNLTCNTMFVSAFNTETVWPAEERGLPAEQRAHHGVWGMFRRPTRAVPVQDKDLALEIRGGFLEKLFELGLLSGDNRIRSLSQDMYL